SLSPLFQLLRSLPLVYTTPASLDPSPTSTDPPSPFHAGSDRPQEVDLGRGSFREGRRSEPEHAGGGGGHEEYEERETRLARALLMRTRKRTSWSRRRISGR
ncbi:unnamed protein product, partial [Musa acuminata subsp. burmannicoides]